MSAKIPLLYMATDGSASRHSIGRYPTYCFVTNEGFYKVKRLDNYYNINEVELYAIIYAAMFSYYQADQVVIYSDNKTAIKDFNYLLKYKKLPNKNYVNPYLSVLEKDKWYSKSRTKNFSILEKILFNKVFKVQVVWVKSHSGHPLNDAADRISLNARRFKSNSNVEKMRQNIASEAALEFNKNIRKYEEELAKPEILLYDLPVFYKNENMNF